MKHSLVAMLIFTVFVTGITLAYKSAQSLMFIKPGGGISLNSLGLTNSQGQGVWSYSLSSNIVKQEESEGALASSHVFQFLHDPINPQNAYAATSAGLYEYQGATHAWIPLGISSFPSGANVYSVSVNSQNPSHLFVVASRTGGAASIWRSEDGGKNFTRVYTSSSSSEPIVDVLDDWYAPQRVFALSNTGIFLRSDDEGLSWRIAYTFSSKHVTHLVMDMNDSRILYALDPALGMMVSTNSGASWQSNTSAFSGFPASAKNINAVRSFKGAAGTLYLATNYGMLRSENQGKTLQFVRSLIEPNSIAAKDIDFGKNVQTIIAAAGNALYISRDGGTTWENHPVSTGQIIQSFIYLPSAGEKIFLTY